MNTTLSSREFNQDTSRAKKASQSGPVIITDRGRPAHVLLTYEAWRALSNARTGIAERLAMPEGADLDLEFPRARDLARPAAFD